MREVYARVAEAYAGVGGSKEHGGAGFIVRRVRNGTADVSGGKPERFGAPEIAYWIRSLVGRAKDGPVGRDAFGERDRGPRAYSDDVNNRFRSDVNKDRSAATLAFA